MANLLSYPTLVESPFIQVKIGDYTFGTYDSKKHGKRVTYPNYMDSIEITKVNGAVNVYSIGITYQIVAGADPNFMDKVFSSVGYGKIKISYGDYSAPSFVYQEEEALITKVSQNVDFSNSKITYQVSCTSTSLVLAGSKDTYAKREKKPSEVIKELLKNNTGGILTLFPGMKSKSVQNALIASDDKSVTIPQKTSVDILTYLNFLVSCMVSSSNTSSTNLGDSSYHLVIYDDIYNEYGGTFFKITKVSVNAKNYLDSDIYEIDVGYPGDPEQVQAKNEADSLVTSFKINEDNSWNLLYNYNGKIQQNNYVYKIDENGNTVIKSSPNIMTSSKYKETTVAQQSWWTNMTQYPITAELVLKGLVRPQMLMTYLRINSYFFGQKHISSGLYVITKQVDRVDRSGYRTTLSLTRIAGDDSFKNTVNNVTSKTSGTYTPTLTNYQQFNQATDNGINVMTESEFNRAKNSARALGCSSYSEYLNKMYQKYRTYGGYKNQGVQFSQQK